MIQIFDKNYSELKPVSLPKYNALTIFNLHSAELALSLPNIDFVFFIDEDSGQVKRCSNLEECNDFYNQTKLKKEIKHIQELRPTFKIGGIEMVDWFTVVRGDVFCTIRSGLVHADGITKSPYYYIHTETGDNSAELCVKHFNSWWEEKNKQ